MTLVAARLAPDLYESVCALSPMELMYHLYEMPAELANISLPVVQ